MSHKGFALVTGCSDGGIGCALAHAFLDRGYYVFASARNVKKMASFVGRSNVTLVTLDVTKDEEVAAAREQIETQTEGKLDFLVNNAARNHWMPILDEDIKNVQALFDSNVFGPLRTIKAFGPLLVRSKGTAVTVTSISGYINMPWMGTYSATKRSSQIISETLRLELEPFGVRVLSLVTGPVETNGLTYFDDFALPETSLYKSIEPIIKRRAHGEGNPKNRHTAEEYAAHVMPAILGKSGVVWGPSMTVAFVKFAVNWLSSSITDSMWRPGTGLTELKADIAGKKKA